VPAARWRQPAERTPRTPIAPSSRTPGEAAAPKVVIPAGRGARRAKATQARSDAEQHRKHPDGPRPGPALHPRRSDLPPIDYAASAAAVELAWPEPSDPGPRSHAAWRGVRLRPDTAGGDFRLPDPRRPRHLFDGRRRSLQRHDASQRARCGFFVQACFRSSEVL